MKGPEAHPAPAADRAEPEARTPSKAPLPDGPVLLFDGLCNLCNGAVHFVLDHERSASLRFAPLQSDLARALVENAFGPDEASALLGGATGQGALDSMVLVDGPRGFTRSTAALHVVRHLAAPYRWLFALIVVPRPLRDVVYGWIGRNRYRWFGKTETCRVPTPALRARFLA
ncbi:MAG: DUF393 domain-containing protein [Labilithrix sp.]|nr:DUF393 domain-containing protein [Labilithrix sp.]